MTKSEIRKDIQAFADDDTNIIFDSDGTVMFTRNGQDLSFKVITDSSAGTKIRFEDKDFFYRDFFAREIARLDLFAARIVEKRKFNDVFIDGPATLKTVVGETTDTCLGLLELECDNFYQFATKVNFVTADAGHGKTALLKKFQYLQAKRFLSGESKYIFWHVDLQGRDLVRLPEAIMYDLGELRISGLFYSSVLYLIKNNLIILAIDGFDELAAEIGGLSALGALSSLVSEMDGQGTLVAASRRTFFDTNDYLKRTKYLKGTLSPDCEFNELKLNNWGKNNILELISYYFDKPDEIYADLVVELRHESEHPILTRPFLLTKVIQVLQEEECEPSDFFGMINGSNEGIALVVEGFIKREVNKWKEWDQQTGKPYLTYEQHMAILETVAKEMWDNQKEVIAKEEVQFLTTILSEEWQIDETIKPKIIRLVESHAFLIPVSDNRPELRKFEHEEFKNYFLSRSLANIINITMASGSLSQLKKFLSINALPDSVAQYCFNYVDSLAEKWESLISILKQIVSEEWKPSYIQQNIGTLIPFILSFNSNETPVVVDMRANYSSLVFENKVLKSIMFIDGEFINISLRNTSFEQIQFIRCRFNEIRFELDSLLNFDQVAMINCEVSSIQLRRNQEIIEAIFSPIRITQVLQQLGIKTESAEIQDEIVNTEFRKLVNKFLLRFNKTVYQYEKNIVNERHYGSQSETVINILIPLLIKYGILEEKETKQSKQTNSRAWILAKDLNEIMSYDGTQVNHLLSDFWREVNQIEF